MLRVIGKCVYVESNAYDFVNQSGERLQGTTHTARVETGRGRYEDVRVREADLPSIPRDADLPEDGLAVDWEVELRSGKPTFVAVHVPRTAAVEGSRRIASAS